MSPSGVAGKVDFVVDGETYETWYKVIGDLTSTSRPLVVLHGGPGIGYQYMQSHVELCATRGIPVVLYSQIGIGDSTHLPDKPKSFWTVDLFIDELENLLLHLDISDNYDLLGHSWGGMLAASFVVERQPRGLKRLVLVSTPASMDLWVRSVRGLLEGMPAELRDTILEHENAGTTDDPAYQDAMMAFYVKHACTLKPWPKELNEAMGAMMADPTVYHTMLGPSEFTIVGTLEEWTVVDKLHAIAQPTLLINGAQDEAQDICMAPLFQRIPKAKWVRCDRSSHMSWLEEKEKYFQIVGDFLMAN